MVHWQPVESAATDTILERRASPVRRALSRWLEIWGGKAEVVADLHAYGGLLLAAVGAEALVPRPGAGWLLAGLGLLYLRRGGR